MMEIIQKGHRVYETVELDGEEFKHSYWEPTIGRCTCGNTVALERSLTNICEQCGREYNGSGQELAPREFWGEETGETIADIMRGNHLFT